MKPEEGLSNNNLKKDLDKTTVRVYFLISGDNLIPDEVTRHLNIVPSATQIKGEPIRNGNKILIREARFTSWKLDSGTVESLDIDIQLKEVCAPLLPKITELKEIKTKLGVEFGFEIVIKIEHSYAPAAHLSKWFLDFAHAIGAEVDFDLYCFSIV